jgi:hypothetical protein
MKFELVINLKSAVINDKKCRLLRAFGEAGWGGYQPTALKDLPREPR